MSPRADWGSRTRTLVVALAAFAAIAAIGGAVLLVLGPQWLVPHALLAHTPFTSFLPAALLLGFGVGGACLLAAVLAYRRARGAVDLTLLAGGAVTVWIVAASAITRSYHPIHALFLALGLVLLVIGGRAAWTTGVARHRWVVTVTAAEWLGFMVPLSVGMASAPAGLTDLAKVELITAAGLVEGFVLGLGQAHAFPLTVHRLRYATYTGLAAGLVWLLAMGTVLLGHDDHAPIAMVAAAILASGIIGLTAIGAAQWIELRHFTRAAPEWIGWTALAWALALPLSFMPSPFVDESTPVTVVAALWAVAGLGMAYVMALVTWQGAKRLTRKHTGLYDEHPSVRRPSASIMPAR